MATARQLSDFPVDQLPPGPADDLRALLREYLSSMQLNADMPEEQMNLGMYYLNRGDRVAAEKAYRNALKLSPLFVPAMLNLADMYRASGMDEQAEPLLLRATTLAPSEASPLHALGLLKVRQGKLEEALVWLQKAAEADPRNYRYGYVYAVALWEAGKRGQAVAGLESMLERLGGNREIVSALASYYQQMGEDEKLRLLMERYAPPGG